MEGKITELMVGIRDVRAYIREINDNLSWMNSQLVSVLNVIQ